MAAEKFFDDRCGLVAAAEPNDYRGLAGECGHVGKVGVLGHQHERVRFGMLPDDGVVGFCHASFDAVLGWIGFANRLRRNYGGIGQEKSPERAEEVS
jgi:hypothetical protein